MKIDGRCAALYPNQMFVDLDKYEKLEKENAELKNKVEEYKDDASKYWGFTKEWEKDYNKLKAEQQDTINELKNTIERQEILIDKMRGCKICTHYQSCLDNDLLYGEVMGWHNGCIEKSKWELEEDIDD